MKIVDSTKSFTDVSRRSFLKGTAALGTTAALYGCGSDSSDDVYYSDPVDTVTPDPELEYKVVYGTGTHNCGGRCVSKLFVRNGRIARIMTDESTMAYDGTYLDTNSRNLPQTRSCSRCRSYRYRVHHPGRLRYPLKQMGKRGDLTSFVRVSWDEALKDILTKHKAVYDKYGVDGIHVLYDSSANNGVQGRDAMETIYKYLPGNAYKWEFGSYSTHQWSYIGVGYTGMSDGFNHNNVCTYTKTLILWGDNSMTTANNTAYAFGMLSRDMKSNNPDSQIVYIGPEFSDTGIVTADKWVVSKPFTDPALIAGMIYHMLDNTFNADGTIKADPWLDVNYLDTMVYGFFDSPAYGLGDDGVIGAAGTGNRDVPAVPKGRSYCSWIRGNATGPNYVVNNTPSDTTIANYTANRLATLDPAFPRWSPCSYQVTKGANTFYKMKKEFQTPKTPAWASAITGVPEDTIKELARLCCKNKPMGCTWSGGQQKQHDGIANLFAVQALHIVTGNVSEYGVAHARVPGPSTVSAKGGLPSITNANIAVDIPAMPNRARFSCTAWHTTIKGTYASELKANGYRAKYIPNWTSANAGTIATGDGDIYWDDAGSKARLLTWDRSNDPAGKKVNAVTVGSKTYYQWKADPSDPSKPLISGIRLLYNSASNIVINQHENSNDSADMLEHLNPCVYNDADTFCMVTFDNFLSPTARWSDYVLPMSTTFEHPNIATPNATSPYFAEQAVNPPGESKQAWSLGVDVLQKYSNLFPGDVGTAVISNAAAKYAGGDVNNSIEGIARQKYYTGPYADPTSPFYQKSWEEYLKNPVLVHRSNDHTIPVPANYAVKRGYHNMSAAERLNPYIKNTANFYIATNTYEKGGYAGAASGTGSANGDFADVSTAPAPSLRYQVYSPILVWQYENQLNRWLEYFGQAGLSKAGQHNTDFEGDPIVIQIPAYYAYQDYFMEAYGNDPAKLTDLPFLLTTTHDKFRSHSSLAENPLMRELCHRVPGQDDKGRPLSGNDWGYYAMAPKEYAPGGTGTYPYLAAAIEADGTVKPENKDIASYSEIFINEDDGKELLGLKDGDLVLVENPIGAVQCVAHLTRRCARGYVGLHQGNWYDPRKGIQNSYNHPTVDVGGNCNTLMASQPSRIDHGNGQQSAMVKITKVNL